MTQDSRVKKLTIWESRKGRTEYGKRRKEKTSGNGNNAANVAAIAPKENNSAQGMEQSWNHGVRDGGGVAFILFYFALIYKPSCSLIDSRTMRSYSCDGSVSSRPCKGR
jgi:hypothetical protein